MIRTRLFYIALLFGVISLTSCKAPQELEFRGVSGVDVKRPSDGGMALDVRMKVHNPNKFKVSVLNYDLDIAVNGKALGEAQSNKKQSIKGGETKDMSFTVKTNLMKLLGFGLGSLGGKLAGDGMKVKVNGTTKVKAFLIKKTLDVDYETSVDLND